MRAGANGNRDGWLAVRARTMQQRVRAHTAGRDIARPINLACTLFRHLMLLAAC